MKSIHLLRMVAIVLTCLLVAASSVADTIVMPNNRTIVGTAIQTNGDDILILTRCAVFNFSKTSIKEIKAEPTETNESPASRLPTFQAAVLSLSQQPWATNLSPIPATVIDKGILRNVPYTSLHCGSDYEVNVYGDLENPSGIEIGMYRKLLNDNSAKDNCIKFIEGILSQRADKEILQSLDLMKDLKTRDDLTFEITPPTADDSYNGWWISVYSEKQLNLARASDNEMKLISMSRADVAKDTEESTNFSSWSSDDLKYARRSAKETITFYNSSGVLIKNAEVVRVIDGVSLIWKDGPTSSGMVKLADLPEDLRKRYGYDEAKSKAADETARANQERWHQEALAAQAAQPAAAQDDSSYSSYADYSGSDYSGGGRVYVHGYTRSNGTYVQPYTRSYP